MAGEPEGESIPWDLLRAEDFSIRHFQVLDFSDCHVLWVFPAAAGRFLRFCPDFSQPGSLSACVRASGSFAPGNVITNIGRNRYIVKGDF